MLELSRKRRDEIGTVIFDFDGTLATCPYDFARMRESILWAAAQFGIDPVRLGPHTGLLEMIEVGVALCEAKPAHATAFRKAAMDSLCALEYEAAAYTELFPGTVDALHALQTAGYRLGIITRNSTAAVARIIGQTALPVEEILCRESVCRPKPHPEHVLRMLHLLQSQPERSLMVGDHPMDIETGKAVGMPTAGVLTGQTDAVTLRAAGPDGLYPSVVELAEQLLR